MAKARPKEENITALAKKHGLKMSTLHKRIRKYGWSIERALSTPTLQPKTTKKELKVIKDHYRKNAGRNVDLKALKGKLPLPRTVQWISTTARSLGLTDRRRPGNCGPRKGYNTKVGWMDAEQVDRFIKLNTLKMSNRAIAEFLGAKPSATSKRKKRLGVKSRPSDMWKHNPHPKGMKGKTLSKEAKRKVSEASKKTWEDLRSHPEKLQAMYKKAFATRRKNGFFSKPRSENVYSRCRRGKRADLGGQFFRSSWEANYARYLNWMKERGLVLDWKYESRTFEFHKVRRGVRFYTPDFWVRWAASRFLPEEHEGYVEIKGWFDKKSIIREHRMEKYYPEFPIHMVGPHAYRAMERNVSDLIPGWERIR